MKLKVKDNTVTEIALNKQIYVVDKDGYVNIPDGLEVDESLFELDTTTAKKTDDTTKAETTTK
jgi:hypothetical protein